MRIRFLFLAVAIAAACAAPYQSVLGGSRLWPDTAGVMFDRVGRIVLERLYDSSIARRTVPSLIAEFRPAAIAARDPDEERAVIWKFLSRIPVSHLALLSGSAARSLHADIGDTQRLMSGLQLLVYDGRYYATTVLSGGPADSAGIRSWDEIVAVDGRPTRDSPLLGWRTDDAYLDDDRDPPVHPLLLGMSDTISLRVVRVVGETLDVRIRARPYSALDASRASIRLIQDEGVPIGYVHWWYMHQRGTGEMLTAALQGPLNASAALVLDLRGRGGSDKAVWEVLGALTEGPGQRFRGPVVALMDRQTRSAKEILAYELRARGVARLVGEPTAGAVVGANFVDLPGDVVLMVPTDSAPQYTSLLESHPVMADLPVAWGGPHSGNRDPILEAGLSEAVRLVGHLGPGIALPEIDALQRRAIAAYGGERIVARYATLSGSGTARAIAYGKEGAVSYSLGAASLETVMMVDSAPVTAAPDTVGLPWQWLLDAPLRVLAHRPLNGAAEEFATFDGEACIRLRSVGSKGPPELFVAVRTFLPRAMTFVAGPPSAPRIVTVTYRAYRQVSGVMVPTVINVDIGKRGAELALDHLEVP